MSAGNDIEEITLPTPVKYSSFLSGSELQSIKDIAKSRIFPRKHDRNVFFDSKIHQSAPVLFSELKAKIDKIPEIFGTYEVGSQTIMHILEQIEIHTDTSASDTSVPLIVHIYLGASAGEESSSKVVFFKQRSPGRQATFIRGSDFEDMSVHGNHIFCTADYKHLQGYTGVDFERGDYQNHLSYLSYDVLHGLSLDKEINLQPGDLFLFDASQLHCSGEWVQGNADKMFLFFELRQKTVSS